MKIVLLTHSEDRHYYFANSIIEQTGAVVGVVTGAKFSKPRPRTLSEKWKRGDIQTTIRNKFYGLIFRSCSKRLHREKKREELAAFGGAKTRFETLHGALRLVEVDPAVGSVNHDRYVELIRAAKPDVICIMGTCLVGKKIIESAPLVLNIHTGLSPYYRGGNTNLWPMLEGDFGYFGVTVHKISLGIDSGDIIFTRRPQIFSDDNFGRINTRCVQMGVELMIESLRCYEAGSLRSVKQWDSGKLFFDRDMNARVACRYFRVRDSFLAEHVRREREGTLDSPRIIENGESVA